MVEVVIGSLSGCGNSTSPMIRGVIATWLTVGLATVSVVVFEGGMGWIWGSYIVALPIAIVGNWRAFRQRTTVVERVEVEEQPVGAFVTQVS